MSQTVSPPPTLVLPGPSPLPRGWTAALVKFELDEQLQPARRVATLRLTGPLGRSFHAVASCPDHVLWGLTAEEVALYMWPLIAEYVARTIADQGTAAAPDSGLDVPVVFSTLPQPDSSRLDSMVPSS